jgi:hypothetical protein
VFLRKFLEIKSRFSKLELYGCMIKRLANVYKELKNGKYVKYYVTFCAVRDVVIKFMQLAR